MSRTRPTWETTRSPGWSERVLVLWEEDDALRSDRSAEHLDDAVVRIVGTMYDCARRFFMRSDGEVQRLARPRDLLGPVIDTVDHGDCVLHLYARGWVVMHSHDGDALGRVVAASAPPAPFSEDDPHDGWASSSVAAARFKVGAVQDAVVDLGDGELPPELEQRALDAVAQADREIPPRERPRCQENPEVDLTRLTLPGDTPGLLRRGSPIVLDGTPTTGVVVDLREPCTVAFHSPDGLGAVLTSRPPTVLRLDLRDPTGRTHLAWWIAERSAGVSSMHDLDDRIPGAYQAVVGLEDGLEPLSEASVPILQQVVAMLVHQTET